ncbi:hypothetical protein G6514_001861 [Epicoccum nigrum]|nr:hypothetical protein G6514_001861 [Epicoccum nigrum]
MRRPQMTTGFLLALCLALSDTAFALSIKHPVRAVSYSALGCYTDNANGKRALTGKSMAADDMSVQKCATFCSQFSLFGLEYGRECYCGNSRDEGSVKASENDCSFSCVGDPNGAEKCGAGDRLNFYSNQNIITVKSAALPGVTSLGCFVDNGNRVLPMGFANAQDMTAAKCAQNCAGYSYFGTQYSSECYCGHTVPTTSAPASECNMACAGNSDELCGGGMRLNVYQVDPPSAATAVSSSAAASTTPTPTTPSIVVAGYGYQGCYTDNVPQRVLSGKNTADAAMTLEKCAAFCSKSGYSWFGVEYSSECYCGTILDPLSVPSREGACNAQCSGDASQKCGGANLLNVYKNAALAAPTPQSSASLNGFKYKSCWTDDVNDRSLKGMDYRVDDMTTKKCADKCTDYAYFGIEYGSECYCGATLSGKAASEADCGMLCSGATGLGDGRIEQQ